MKAAHQGLPIKEGKIARKRRNKWGVAHLEIALSQSIGSRDRRQLRSSSLLSKGRDGTPGFLKWWAFYTKHQYFPFPWPSLLCGTYYSQAFWDNCITLLHRITALCSYREQLGTSEILKSIGPDLAQFLSKFDNFTFGWCKTVKR